MLKNMRLGTKIHGGIQIMLLFFAVMANKHSQPAVVKAVSPERVIPMNDGDFGDL